MLPSKAFSVVRKSFDARKVSSTGGCVVVLFIFFLAYRLVETGE